jgi:hypothetical protein
MATLEKRRSPRVDVDNFVSYYLLDENDKIFHGGFGKSKNISDVGIQIVTSEIIEADFVIVAIIDEGNNFIEIKGKVRHSRKDKNNIIYTGIELIGDNDEKSEFAMLFKSAYRSYQD